jgi:hypothetical protein
VRVRVLRVETILEYFCVQKTAAELYPSVDVSEARLVPPLRIIARSTDQKTYKVIAEHPSGDVTILVRDLLFTPTQDGNFTVLKADAVDFLE